MMVWFTHLKPAILECEVKEAFGNITVNKTSGGDGIPAELFQILKDVDIKMLHSICQQIWKIDWWPQERKVSFHSNLKREQHQRMFRLLLNCTHFTFQQGNAPNPSRLQQYVNREFQLYKPDLEKAEEPDIHCQHLLDHRKSKGIPEKNLLLLY